jgi:hypothetical protein
MGDFVVGQCNCEMVSKFCTRPEIMADYGRLDVEISLLLVKVNHYLIVLNGDHHLVFGHYVSEGRLADVAFPQYHDTALGLDLMDMVIGPLKICAKFLEPNQLLGSLWWNDLLIHIFTNNHEFNRLYSC